MDDFGLCRRAGPTSEAVNRTLSGLKEVPVCSHCGCDAIPVIEALMADHAVMAANVRRIERALDAQKPVSANSLTAELARSFAHHRLVEHAGLFSQLLEAGELQERIDRLELEDAQLSAALVEADARTQPERLRRVLAQLVVHNNLENNEVFPLALQLLPLERWGAVEAIHQRFLVM